MSIKTYTLTFTDVEHERILNVYKDLVVNGTVEAFLVQTVLERVEDVERILGNVPEYYEKIKERQQKTTEKITGEILKELHSPKRTLCQDSSTCSNEGAGT